MEAIFTGAGAGVRPAQITICKDEEMTDGPTERPKTDPLSVERTRLAALRVHLANERTFLAWLRTALGVMAFGFLLEKFDVALGGKDLPDFQIMSHEIGLLSLAAFTVAGLLMVMAVRRFFSVRKTVQMSRSFFHPFRK